MAGPTAANRKLFAAAKKGDADGVRAALAAGAEVTARDGNGWTALHEACRWGRLEATQALLAAGADANAKHPENEYTPLYVATFSPGNAAIVRALVAGGAAPSLATSHGWTALHNAAQSPDLEAVEALLAAGADPAILGGPEKKSPSDCASPAEADAVRRLIARHAATAKQPAEAARVAAGASARAPAAPAAQFVEARPLAIDRIRVAGAPTLVSADDLAALRKIIGAELPSGYAELLLAHGPGTLVGKVRVYGPRTIIRDRERWRARLTRHWFWGAGPLLTQDDAVQAVLVADTLDGDELVFHPRAPDTLLLLPRESKEILLASRSGLLPALARMLVRVPAKIVLEPLGEG
jgi:hypothetical protein